MPSLPQWYGVIRQILRLISLDLKQKKKNHTLIYLSISIVKKSIKLIAIYIYFGNIGSIRNGIQRSIKSFMKTEVNQFA